MYCLKVYMYKIFCSIFSCSKILGVFYCFLVDYIMFCLVVEKREIDLCVLKWNDYYDV